MLELQRVSKSFAGYPVVRQVSFTLAAGEIVGYLGRNGAGKSTTVKMIAGLLEPSAGRILFHGRDIVGQLPVFKARIGYVPEQSDVYPHLSAEEYLLLVGRLRSIPEAELRAKIDRLMQLFGLAIDMYLPMATYSKGMRQKVVIAAALLHDPDILLLDEPLSGLDVSSTLVMYELLQELAAAGKAILFSSHVLDVVERICHRVMILHQGRLAACDTVGNLRSLMHLSSLESIFRELVQQEDPRAVARDMLAVVRLSGGRP
jgi:ABC-2 type transport system ATP-binding protein